jgi:hypothetical protein
MEKIPRLKKLINKIYYNIFVELDTNLRIEFNFTSEKRWDLINEIIKKKKLEKYLEIGCDDDFLFNKINLPDKIGVDPRQGGNVRKTSDEFFESNQNFFDIIFIDGLHQYEQVNKDIENSLKFLNEGGFIFLHDCLPSTLKAQAVPRYKIIWNGDVWKSIVKFRHDKNLSIQTIAIDYGISVIQKKVNKNPLNLKIKDYKNLKFKDFFNHHNEYMNITSYHEFINSI